MKNRKAELLERIEQRKQDSPLVLPAKKGYPIQSSSDPVADLAPKCSSIQSGLEFRFEDLAQQSRNIRAVYRKIERELRVDLSSGPERWKHQIINAVRHFAGIKKQTLAELFQETANNLSHTCTLIGNLHGACYGHHAGLMAYLDMNEDRLAAIAKTAPRFAGMAEASDRHLASARQRLHSYSTDNPEYYLQRREWRHRRVESRRAHHSVYMLDHVKGLVDNITVRVDALSELLMEGEEFARETHATYFIAEECIRKVGSGSSMVRELFRHSGVLYDLVQDLHTAFDHAYNIERKFENPRLVTRVYRTMPSLPGGRNAAGLLDYLNAQFIAGKIKQLVR